MAELFVILSILLSMMALGLGWQRAKKSTPELYAQMKSHLLHLEKTQENLNKSIREEFGSQRQEHNLSARQSREELSWSFATLQSSILSMMREHSHQQKHLLESFAQQLARLTQMNEQKLNEMRTMLEMKLTSLQEDNHKKLEQMRQTVDEKLHSTLEQRLGQSFKLVSERLEQVHKGLGEMRTLASDVGSLKNVLSNVKNRGIMGEIQLENLLEQILTTEQYEKNVAIQKESSERVEFAVKLPAKEEEQTHVWLPIDSKFPLEDYQRLLDAQEANNLQLIHEATKNLENQIKLEAKRIRDKYIATPHTTDFAILFVPLEGLYAEVLRRPGLFERIQREYRVVISGPTTLSAFLNSLQMGFRTLVIQKRSSEVWQILGAVKTEFGKFGTVLEKAQKKLQEASHTIEQGFVRTRQIERRLRSVQELPVGKVQQILAKDSST
jgi:DNA recombination protein RmuC